MADMKVYGYIFSIQKQFPDEKFSFCFNTGQFRKQANSINNDNERLSLIFIMSFN